MANQRVVSTIFFQTADEVREIKFGSVMGERYCDARTIQLGNVSIHVDGELWPAFCERVRTALIGNELEPCCNCGEDYPRAEMLAGNIYCGKCLAKYARPKEAAHV